MLGAEGLGEADVILVAVGHDDAADVRLGTAEVAQHATQVAAMTGEPCVDDREPIVVDDEQEGDAVVAEAVDALTMQAVADRVGVRAPSLYKRVAGRDALLAAVVAAALDDLVEAIVAASDAAAPHDRLVAMAKATRAFARANPVGYGLVFAPPPTARPDATALAHAAAPLLAATRELVGDAAALDAARLLTAWLHGFLGMELAGAFRLGGDVDRAFEYGLERILESVAA